MFDYEDAEGDDVTDDKVADDKVVDDKGAKDTEQTVSYVRFQKVVAAKNAALERAAALEADVQKYSEKAATVDTLAAEVQKWKGVAAAAQAKFTTHRDIAAGLGTTVPDVIEAAEWQYSKLPAEGRPPIADWIKSMKDKPDEASVILRPFLAPPVVADKKAVVQPRPVGNGKQPGSETRYSAAELKAARDKAMATGDFTELRAMRKSWRPEAADKT